MADRHCQCISSIIRSAHYVPETKKVPELLKVLQEKKLHMAVVVDEYGSAVGIVTIEDLLEEIVGEIRGEHEVAEELYQVLQDGGYLIDARMEVDAVNEELGLGIEKGPYETLGGYLLYNFQEIPSPGAGFGAGGYKYSVVEATEKSIIRVKASPIPHDAGEATGPSPEKA